MSRKTIFRFFRRTTARPIGSGLYYSPHFDKFMLNLLVEDHGGLEKTSQKCTPGSQPPPPGLLVLTSLEAFCDISDTDRTFRFANFSDAGMDISSRDEMCGRWRLFPGVCDVDFTFLLTVVCAEKLL